jgi:hypothetical protein
MLINQTIVHGVFFSFDTLRFSRLIADWLVKNMNPDMTPSGMLLDVSEKRYNNHLILIRLIQIYINRFLIILCFNFHFFISS